MNNDKQYLDLLTHRAKGAIERGATLNEAWYMMYAATLYRDNEPDFIARPLIYDRMTDAEKAGYLRLNNLLVERIMNDIEPICKLCLAVYERELPKMIDELQALENTQITSKYDTGTI